METLIARNEFVGRRQTRHHTALLQPVDRAEGGAKEDALHDCKGHEARRKVVVFGHDPFLRPFGLSLDARDGLCRMKEIQFLRLVLNVGINEKRIHLAVNSLYHHLDRVEVARLRVLNLGHEPRRQILLDDAIGTREEGKDVFNKGALGFTEFDPVFTIALQAHLLHDPEDGQVIFVLLVEFRFHDGKKSESVWIFPQHRLHERLA